MTSTVIDAGAYSAALQESTLARQRARQVLAGPAPFAVQPGEGGAAAAPPAEAYHYRRPGEVQPPAKVGSRSPEARVAGHKPASLSPKVGAGAWGCWAPAAAPALRPCCAQPCSGWVTRDMLACPACLMCRR